FYRQDDFSCEGAIGEGFPGRTTRRGNLAIPIIERTSYRRKGIVGESDFATQCGKGNAAGRKTCRCLAVDQKGNRLRKPLAENTRAKRGSRKTPGKVYQGIRKPRQQDHGGKIAEVYRTEQGKH